MSDADAAVHVAVIQTKLEALSRRVDDALTSRDKALDVALSSLNSHLAVMNEFRGALSDQAARYVTRVESEAINDKIGLINDRLNRAEGETRQRRESRSENSSSLGNVVGIVVGVVGILAFLLSLVVFFQRPSSVAPTVVSPAVIPVQPPK